MSCRGGRGARQQMPSDRCSFTEKMEDLQRLLEEQGLAVTTFPRQRTAACSPPGTSTQLLFQTTIGWWRDWWLVFFDQEKKLVLYALMANLINLMLQWPEIDIREITENFSKLSCNAHTICDCELRPLGTGLYPVIAIINHRTAIVHAVLHVAKGSEVFISYIETAASTAARRKSLKEQYFSDCSCIHCAKLGTAQDIKESAILEGYRCWGDRCFGFLLHDSENEGFMCQECELVRSKEEIRKITAEEKGMSEEASARSKQALLMFKKIEKLQEELYHPFSVILLRTQEKIIKILMDQEDWTEALNTAD